MARNPNPNTANYKRVLGIEDPNELAHPIIPESQATVAPTCQFLGKTFYQGDTITYNGSQWICSGGNWQQEGQ